MKTHTPPHPAVPGMLRVLQPVRTGRPQAQMTWTQVRMDRRHRLASTVPGRMLRVWWPFPEPG